MSAAAGCSFSPYEIIAPLGEGGMGEVFKARDARLGRIVALRVPATALPIASPTKHAPSPR